MHECPECGQACDCDGEDVWNEYASFSCTHVCEDTDDDDTGYSAYLDGREDIEPITREDVISAMVQTLAEAHELFCENEDYPVGSDEWTWGVCYRDLRSNIEALFPEYTRPTPASSGHAPAALR